MYTNECVCVKIWHLFHIHDRSIDSKLISVCLINNYSLIADLHIFVYGRAECTSISLECTKVKLLIWKNYYNQNCIYEKRLSFKHKSDPFLFQEEKAQGQRLEFRNKFVVAEGEFQYSRIYSSIYSAINREQVFSN